MAKKFDHTNNLKLKEKSEYFRSLEKKSATNRLFVDGIYSNLILEEVFNRNK